MGILLVFLKSVGILLMLISSLCLRNSISMEGLVIILILLLSFLFQRRIGVNINSTEAEYQSLADSTA